MLINTLNTLFKHSGKQQMQYFSKASREHSISCGNNIAFEIYSLVHLQQTCLTICKDGNGIEKYQEL